MSSDCAPISIGANVVRSPVGGLVREVLPVSLWCWHALNRLSCAQSETYHISNPHALSLHSLLERIVICNALRSSAAQERCAQQKGPRSAPLGPKRSESPRRAILSRPTTWQAAPVSSHPPPHPRRTRSHQRRRFEAAAPHELDSRDGGAPGARGTLSADGTLSDTGCSALAPPFGSPPNAIRVLPIGHVYQVGNERNSALFAQPKPVVEFLLAVERCQVEVREPPVVRLAAVTAGRV